MLLSRGDTEFWAMPRTGATSDEYLLGSRVGVTQRMLLEHLDDCSGRHHRQPRHWQDVITFVDRDDLQRRELQ